MAHRILALDLGTHALKAAVIERTLRGCHVLGLFRQRRDLRRALDEQVREFCVGHHLRGDTVLSCLPGDVVTHRLLSLPFARPAQLRQAVPFELESQLPLGLEGLAVDFQVLARTADGVRVLAVAVPKQTLADHLATLATAGLDPTVIGLTPLAPLPLLPLAGSQLHGSVALLDLGERTASVVLLQDGVLSGLRTLSIDLDHVDGQETFVQGLRWTLLSLSGDAAALPAPLFVCGGGARNLDLTNVLQRALEIEVHPFQQLVLPHVPERYREEQGAFAACLGLGLQEALGSTTPVINLRRGEFTFQGKREIAQREWTRLGWIAAGVVVAAGLAFAIERQRLSTRYDALRQEIRRVFTATLPHVQTIVSENAQLQEAVTALQNRRRLSAGTTGHSSLDVLRQLSLAVPEQVTLDLEEWTFEQDTVRLRGTTDSFDAAETMRTTLAGLELFREVQLRDVKTTAGGKKVTFGLHMRFRTEGQ